jgi:hypothetical protein
MVDNKDSDARYSLKVQYNTEYHYPSKIASSVSYASLSGMKPNGVNNSWTITLTSREEYNEVKLWRQESHE